MNKILYVLFSISLLVSCSKTRFDEHSHSHEGEEQAHDDHGHGSNEIENYRVTEFSNHFEIFAEINPLIAGEESQFTIHYTKLSDFKPVTNAKLNIIITGSMNDNIEINNVSRPGIFIAKYKPQTSGIINMNFVLKDGNVEDTIQVNDFQCFATKEEAKKNEQKAEDGITFLKEEAWKINFAMEKIVPIEFSNVIKSTGKVIYNPSDELNLTAGSSGIIEFLDNSLIIGKQISAGGKLFAIKPGSTREDNYAIRFEQAKSEFNRASKEFARISELHKSKITNEKEFLDAKANMESAEVIYNNYASYSDGKVQIIKSSKSGLITKLFVNPGQYIEAGMPIAVISNSNKMLLQVEIPNNEFMNFGNISGLKIDMNGEIIEGNKLKIKQIGVPISLSNSSFSTINFQFENNTNLIPNTFYSVFLKSNKTTHSLTVPQSSIWEDRGHYFVFVQKHGELFEKREVMIGGFDGSRYAIHDGLKEGEVVVSNGTYRVMLASKSTELPSNTHTH